MKPCNVSAGGGGGEEGTNAGCIGVAVGVAVGVTVVRPLKGVDGLHLGGGVGCGVVRTRGVVRREMSAGRWKVTFSRSTGSRWGLSREGVLGVVKVST